MPLVPGPLRYPARETAIFASDGSDIDVIKAEFSEKPRELVSKDRPR